MKKTTGDNVMVSYLDVAITVNYGQFLTTVYDNRDDFNFKIVNFLHMDSNYSSWTFIWNLHLSVSTNWTNL